MTVVSFTGSSLLDRVGASRAALNVRPGASAASASTPTRVTLSGSGDSAVYANPRTQQGIVRLWASPANQGDAVSALMARNRGTNLYALNDQWRGLGSALLARFAEAGEDYTQTLVDAAAPTHDAALEELAPEERAQRAAEIAASQAEALANVAVGAATAGLKVQTRSGQSVELKIAVGQGMKVELKSSGGMSTDERAAVQKLADGLERALQGLGGDEIDLDLSELLGYDRTAIAGLDLSVDTGQPNGLLQSFSLHLGDDKRTVALKGSDGEMRLNVDTGKPLDQAATPQRQAAREGMLARIDSAGERGRANAPLVEQMKSAFQQLQELQEAAAPADGDGKPTHQAPGETRLTSQLSGLADFDASFGGDTWRTNRFGAHNEAGQVDYQLSQQTTERAGTRGGRSLAQTVTEQLSADSRKAPGGGMLDVDTGNYTATRVRDRSTVTTLIDTLPGGAIRVLRKTDEQQLKTVIDFENHRAMHRQSSPSQRSLVERLS